MYFNVDQHYQNHYKKTTKHDSITLNLRHGLLQLPLWPHTGPAAVRDGEEGSSSPDRLRLLSHPPDVLEVGGKTVPEALRQPEQGGQTGQGGRASKDEKRGAGADGSLDKYLQNDLNSNTTVSSHIKKMQTFAPCVSRHIVEKKIWSACSIGMIRLN